MTDFHGMSIHCMQNIRKNEENNIMLKNETMNALMKEITKVV